MSDTVTQRERAEHAEAQARRALADEVARRKAAEDEVRRLRAVLLAIVDTNMHRDQFSHGHCVELATRALGPTLGKRP